MVASFAIARKDGRSNSDVVVELVKGAQPGHLFEYEDLCKALNEGTDRTYKRKEIQGAVHSAANRLLQEQKRVLECVKTVGYKVALASDHNRLATGRARKADVQMKLGLKTIQNVRWDEMTENERKLAEGTLLVFGAIYQQQQSMEKRISAVEKAIAVSKAGDSSAPKT